MTDKTNQHTFVICAYQESEYLEECIRSLKNQTVRSKILLATSTPNPMIEGLAEKYHIPVAVNKGEHGIVQDWNYAYSQVSTPYVTIAHQDDIYMKKYAETVLAAMERSKRPLIAFCDYCELRDGKFVLKNTLLRVKRLMLSPLRLKAFQNRIWVRRRVLSMGSCICCPSVTFARENLPEVIFTTGFRSSEDWEAWERISRRKGQFVYIPQALMAHRIHSGSETSNIIQDNQRSEEDYQMFRKFWPGPVAKLITKIYSTSEKSNEL